MHYLEFFGNLFPVTKSGDQLSHKFHAFRENRLPFNVRVKDPNNDPLGRISFYREPRQARGEAQQVAICNLNLGLPEEISPEPNMSDQDILAIQAKYSFLREAGYGKFDTIHRADLRVSDISNLLGSDWVKLARELGVEDQDINLIISEYPDNVGQQAMVMLRLWLNTEGNKATGNALEKALQNCDRQDIVNKCMFNISEVTDDNEQQKAHSELARATELNAFKNNTSKSLTRDYSIDVNVDETEYGSSEYDTERLGGIREENLAVQETSMEQEEVTSAYEREEQKYVAEEKEFISSSYNKEVQEQQMSFNQTNMTEDNNIVVTESSYNKQEHMHEDLQKLSIEETKSVKHGDNVLVQEATRIEDNYHSKEEFSKESSEISQTKVEEKDDGTLLILTDSKKQSHEQFQAEAQDIKTFAKEEITSTGLESSEVAVISEQTYQSEELYQGTA